MINWFINLNYIYQALIATTFTYLITMLGASIVFFFKNVFIDAFKTLGIPLPNKLLSKWQKI